MNKFLPSLVTLSVFGVTLAPWPIQAAESILVDLRIQTPEGELYHNWVSTTETCTVTDTTGEDHELTDFSALCALDSFAEVEGKTLDLENSSYGLFLSGIGKHDQDTTQGWYWLYRVNNASPAVGLDAYALVDGDEMLLTLGAWPSAPVALNLSTVDILKGDSVEILVTAYNDGTGEFEPLNEATVYFGKDKYETVTTDEYGKIEVSLSTKGDYNIFASKQDYTTSEISHVRVRAHNDEQEYISRADRKKLLTGALNYLKGQMDENGKIDTIGVTEWAAIAFAAADHTVPKGMRQEVKNYDPDSSSATDLERHILALQAVNANPHDHQGENYVQQLYNKQVSDGQVGDTAYLNDDIFGLLAFLSAGQDANSEELKDITRNILDHQLEDGSFSYSTSALVGDADTTSAAIRALRRAKRKGSVVGVDDAIQQAKEYLESVQRLDGAFAYDISQIDSNSATTAWVILALQKPNKWKINKRHPWTYLTWAQQGDGSFAWIVGMDGDSLTTAYVAHALAYSLK